MYQSIPLYSSSPGLLLLVTQALWVGRRIQSIVTRNRVTCCVSNAVSSSMYTEWAPANTPFGAMSVALGLRAEEDEQVLEQRRGLLIS
ncbi:hypothetical protein F5J12DRAFT_859403, partial [Pisolithus orientalis]|uniref:uncharacterized protein n=1 Tax=Pisolithus orientalis TaxID=936130 RepID=UPI002225578A